MKRNKHIEELDVDYIVSEPLTLHEEKALSAFIQLLKAKKRNKTIIAISNKKSRKRISA
jgi:hypothetical protein